MEDSLGSQEEFALAALKALHHTVGQSSEVVNTLLALTSGAEGSPPQGNTRHRYVGFENFNVPNEEIQDATFLKTQQQISSVLSYSQ